MYFRFLLSSAFGFVFLISCKNQDIEAGSDSLSSPVGSKYSLKVCVEQESKLPNLSPEACILAVNNPNLQYSAATGKLSERFESVENMEYEAAKSEAKAGKRGIPSSPDRWFHSHYSEKNSHAGSPCGLQVIMQYMSGGPRVGMVPPWVETSFVFYVKDPEGRIPLLDSDVVKYDSESWEGSIRDRQIVTKAKLRENGFKGYKYFIKFDGERKITSFGLLSQAGSSQTIKWECKLDMYPGPPF